MKKLFILLIALLILSGCSTKQIEPEITNNTSKPATETTPEPTQNTVKNEILEVKENDTGSGPVTLDFVYGYIFIPEGIFYEVDEFYATTQNPKGKNELDFGLSQDKKGGEIKIISSINVGTLDDAVKECIKLNDLGNEKPTINDNLMINELTYKHITVIDDGKTEDYLITIYPYDNAFNYVEIKFESDELKLNHPLSQEFLKGLQIPKE